MTCHNITLAFAPFGPTTHIPIGIALIKSYVESCVENAHVTAIDLDNHFINRLYQKNFADTLNRLCSICPKKDRRKNSKVVNATRHALYVLGMDCLRDKVSFFNRPKYNALVRAVSYFLNSLIICLSQVMKDALEQGDSIPLLLRRILEEDIELILKNKPDLIGFSIFSEFQLPYTLLFARMIKEKTRVPVVLGGAYMSYINATEILDLFEWIDFVVRGEGEDAILGLIRGIDEQKFEDVPNLSYRVNGSVCHNKRTALTNLDTLPFVDLSDFSLPLYPFPEPVLPVFFSRGCPWGRCAFCAYRSHYPSPSRKKTVARFVEELGHYCRMGIRHFFINDDAVSAEDMNAISTAIKKVGLDISFGAILRPDGTFTPDILRNVHSAGCNVITWGVESSSQRILNLMRKGTNICDIEPLLKEAANIGIENYLFMMHDLPTQTSQEAKNDLDFIEKNLDYIIGFTFHEFSLETGSQIAKQPEKYGLKKLKKVSILKRNGHCLYSHDFIFSGGSKLGNVSFKKRIEQLDRNIARKTFIPFEHTHTLLHSKGNMGNL